MAEQKRIHLREKRKKRTRSKVFGTSERPRLSIFKSQKHIYAQLIDDLKAHTILSVHSFKKGSAGRANKATCAELGKKLAELCKSKNINKIAFDKNGFTYHGRLKALADAAREAGINF